MRQRKIDNTKLTPCLVLGGSNTGNAKLLILLGLIMAQGFSYAESDHLKGPAKPPHGGRNYSNSATNQAGAPCLESVKSDVTAAMNGIMKKVREGISNHVPAEEISREAFNAIQHWDANAREKEIVAAMTAGEILRERNRRAIRSADPQSPLGKAVELLLEKGAKKDPRGVDFSPFRFQDLKGNQSLTSHSSRSFRRRKASSTI